MEYQKMINLLDNTPNQPFKFRTINRVGVNDDAHRRYNTNSQIKLKNSMSKSSLFDSSDVCILFKGNIAIKRDAGPPAGRSNTELLGIRRKDKINNEVAFKNCAQLINCINEINNVQVDNAKDIDIVLPMYNLIEYTDNYSKISGSSQEI